MHKLIVGGSGERVQGVMMAEFLSLQEVAQYFGVSDWAVRSAIQRGELRAIKPCHRIRIHKSEIKRFEIENEIEPRSRPSIDLHRPKFSKVNSQRGSLVARVRGGQHDQATR